MARQTLARTALAGAQQQFEPKPFQNVTCKNVCTEASRRVSEVSDAKTKSATSARAVPGGECRTRVSDGRDPEVLQVSGSWLPLPSVARGVGVRVKDHQGGELFAHIALTARPGNGR
jgi:hypothetical protein